MAMKLNLLYGIQAITVFIFILIISPILFGVYFLFWLWSKFVSHFLVINCSKQEGEDVSAGLNDCQHNTIMNAVIFLEGKFTVEKMQQLFISRVIKAKDENNELLLPKFTQCMVQHYDYWFWKTKTNFDINEHIYYYKESIQSEKEFKKVVNEIINQEISFSKPLWEIIIMPYLVPGSEPQTVCLFRIHHSMCDGITFLRIIISQLGSNDDGMKIILEKAASKRQANVKANFKQKLVKIVQHVCLFVIAPMFILRTLSKRDKHFFCGPKLTNVLHIDWTTHIKLQTIKDIKNSTSTTVNDVVSSCVAGAIRKSFLRNNTLLPKSVHVMVPVNLQGPHNKLVNSNNLSLIFPKFPTGDMDCITRLKKTKIMMDEIKTSPEIITNRLFFTIFGCVLPSSLMKIILSLTPAGIIFSNIPGPQNPIFWAGHKIKNMFPLAQTRSSSGFGVAAFSCGDIVNASVTLDSALISDPSEVSTMLKEIENEIDLLHSSVVQVQLFHIGLVVQ
ncbi:hypothetical protein CHUAL_003844 [Chamberlinius hualienensis]